MDIELEKNPDPLDYQAKMSELGLAEKGGPGSRTSERSPLVRGSISGGMDFTQFFVKVLQPCLAEMIAIAIFVFIDTAAAASANGDLLLVALANGLSLAVAIASLGAISGGHLNPAVTLGVALCGGISPGLALLYFVFQVIGATLGAACCRGILNYDTPVVDGNETRMVNAYRNALGGVPVVGENVGDGNAVLCEIIITFILVMTVLMTALDTRGKTILAPLFIGLAVAVGIMAGGPVSGGSMNPARAIGPCFVTWDLDSSVWDDDWIYWVGPLVGALVAAALYRLIFGDNDRRLILKEKED